MARFTDAVEELGTLLAEIEGEQAADVSLETVFEEIRERRVEVLKEKYGIDAGKPAESVQRLVEETRCNGL
ncbi:MAG: hypothetical protein KF893_05015 [Caldilineaceae bacterium]|nr:hypothetical protein [Caldilineaceae bacterium]